MADINDPEAVRFVNEHTRPFSERLFELYYEAKELLTKYGRYVRAFGTDADDVADGRETEGVSRLQARHIKASVAMAQSIVTEVEAKTKILDAPRVRRAEISRN